MKTKTVTFDKNYLVDELMLPYEGKVHEDKIIDTTRWSIFHSIVFEIDNKYYQTTYHVGATECQYETPWEYLDEVDCIEVELRPVTKLEWMPV